MLNSTQRGYLDEIERLVALVRANDTPCPQNNVIPVEGDLQTAINSAPNDAILDLLGRQHTTQIVIDKPITVRNGLIQAPPNTNDVVVLYGSHMKLRDLLIRGDGTTKRGIQNNATFVEIENVEIRNIRRVGQETQAIAMWNSPGPLTVRNSVLEAGSIGFLAGGSRPTVENTIATGLLFEGCLFTRPREWKTEDWNCKNAFELKSAKDVIVRNCILENVWVQGQTGSAIVLTPVNYGNSPQTVVENVLFDSCIIRNVGNGVNAIGFTQETHPTLRGNNYRFINCQFDISKAVNGDQGALLKVGREPSNIEFEGCNVSADGDAFIRVSDTRPIMDFRFTRNTVNKTGTYGIFTPIGSRGVGFQAIFPAGLVESNIFHSAHAIFKTNFPLNTYMT